MTSGKNFMPAEDAADVEQWELPDVGLPDNASRNPNALGYEADWYQQKTETQVIDEPEAEQQPLTLEEIEAIRQAAYDDGFAEGREQGLAAGHAEGFEKGQREGHEAGVLQGYQTGFEQGESAVNQVVAHWQTLVDHLAKPSAQADHQVEQQLVWMAMQLAKTLIRTDVHLAPDLLLATIKEGISQLPMAEDGVTLELHPDDLMLVQSAYTPEVCEKRNWTLQPEPGLQRGDVVLRSSSSSIDLLLEQRIDQVMRQFIQKNLAALS